MQGTKFISSSTIMILLALCFLSTPGFAGDHPWDIDNGGDNKDITNVGDRDAAQGLPMEKGMSQPPAVAASVPAISDPVVQAVVDYVFRRWNAFGSVVLNAERNAVSDNRRWEKRSCR